MSLKTCIARDISRVFMNTDEFCDNITIQSGTTKLNIIGSLQQNLINNNSGNGSALQDVGWTLYIKYPLDVANTVSVFTVGSRIFIGNKSFTIVSVADELGIATIVLKGVEGR